MPGMNRTGPQGTGPIGRRMGPCGGGQAGWGRGLGFRRGGRFGWDMMPNSSSPDDEKGILEQQKGRLETQLATITQRLQELGTSKESE